MWCDLPFLQNNHHHHYYSSPGHTSSQNDSSSDTHVVPQQSRATMHDIKETAYPVALDAESGLETPLLERGSSARRRAADASRNRTVFGNSVLRRHIGLSLLLNVFLLVLAVISYARYTAALHNIDVLNAQLEHSDQTTGALNAQIANSNHTIGALSVKVANLDQTVAELNAKFAASGPDLLFDRANNASVGIVTLRIGSGGRWSSSASDRMDRSIKTWTNYAQKWGYPFWQGNETLVYGPPNNTPMYSKQGLLLSIMLNEMRKPAGNRLKWLYITDIDTVVLNPNVPLDTFLPPDTSFGRTQMLLANVDSWNTLNVGAFLIRVSHEGIDYLTQTLAFKKMMPANTSLPNSDQSVMTLLIHNPQYNWTDSVAVTPPWFNKNTWQFDWQSGPESLFNNFMAHFAGGDKAHWSEAVQMIESAENQKYIKPLNATQYMVGDNTVAKWWKSWEAMDPKKRREQVLKDTYRLSSHCTVESAFPCLGL